MNKTAVMTVVVIMGIILSIFIKESKTEVSHGVLKNDAVILAFGDSLTYGFGVSKEYSYPSVMQSKIGIRVINGGVNGELSGEGLKRLPKFLEQKLNLVILCHGGNDILQNRSGEELKTNLLEMIKLIRRSGSEVLLVAVPDFNVAGFSILSVYDEVAKESGVMFEDEVLSHIELHRSLKSDYIHPNKEGYAMMAESFIKVLKKYDVLD